jgi:hypothetical protein
MPKPKTKIERAKSKLRGAFGLHSGTEKAAIIKKKRRKEKEKERKRLDKKDNREAGKKGGDYRDIELFPSTHPSFPAQLQTGDRTWAYAE